MTDSDDALKVRPPSYILDLDDVADILASYGPADLRDAMRAIRRLSEQLRSSIVYDGSEGVSFLHTSAEERFEITYEANPHRFRVHHIEISRTPLTEWSGAFVVRHRGKPRAIKIVGPPEGGYLCVAQPARREGGASDIGFDDVEAPPNRRLDEGSNEDVPRDTLVGFAHALTLGAECRLPQADAGCTATPDSAALSLSAAGLGHGPRTRLQLVWEALSILVKREVDATRPVGRSSPTGWDLDVSSINPLSVCEPFRWTAEMSGVIWHSDLLGSARTAFASPRNRREGTPNARVVAGVTMDADPLGLWDTITALSPSRHRDRKSTRRDAPGVAPLVPKASKVEGCAERVDHVLAQLSRRLDFAWGSSVALTAFVVPAVAIPPVLVCAVGLVAAGLLMRTFGRSAYLAEPVVIGGGEKSGSARASGAWMISVPLEVSSCFRNIVTSWSQSRSASSYTLAAS